MIISTKSYNGMWFGLTCFLLAGKFRKPAMTIKPINSGSRISAIALEKSVMAMQ